MPKTWTGSEWRRISDAESANMRDKGYLITGDDASDDAPKDHKGPLAPRAQGAPFVPSAAATSAHGDPFDPRGTPTQLPRDVEDAEREKRGMAPVEGPRGTSAASPAHAPDMHQVPAPVLTDRLKK